MADISRVEAIFNDALELPESDRGSFVEKQCAGDAELRDTVLRLLRKHGELNSFLAPPAGSPSEFDSGTEGIIPPTVPLVNLGVGGQLGKRYRIEERLGEGGMGEVLRATDLKLRVDVALKAVRPGLFSDERAKELLRREVRTAREVHSPHVCRIFDLIVEGDAELVSMEFIDGRTLRQLLQERVVLPLREAGEIAAQLIAGLEAIHEVGLVHRDLKPENVMITRAGRVVVMDFGLAKEVAPTKGTVAGTPGYMAPEQSRGDVVDARADIFSVGVILTEMVGCEGGDADSRRELWRGLREDPPRLPDVPWKSVLRRAVAWNPDERFRTVRALGRALEEVTLRASEDEQVRPYPGLSSFSSDDAQFFFGREAEVESLGKKLRSASMLAVVGPSGIGKSSFLRAGLLPALPEGWSSLVCTPGSSPFRALAYVLVPEVSADVTAMQQLLHLEDPAAAVDVARRWRERHDEALLVVDQFEELFTLSPPQVQSQFTELLSQLVVSADIRVVVSMRDDFLFAAHKHEGLKPIFADLTLLDSLSGPSLRRALVQPALACGYRFEDEELVDQMVKEVDDERGALPMLAFAAAHLWDRREKVTGTLTRKAYREIGGVGGALGQHAESVLESLGEERIPVVRELFRNLVTAQGTRAVLDVDELLSVFEDRDEAIVVLRELVDARLLTTYDRHGAENENGNGRRVEIVHESLLSAWPRIVRWQTQDADGAMLRDQLRQAAHLWDERKRTDDLLWTGTAYREFEIWRENYPGGLSESEQDFAEAMVRRMRRQKQMRRIAGISLISVLLVVLAVISNLWREASVQANRAEAQRLLTLAEPWVEDNRGLALAYTIESLELADTPAGRRLALRTLQSGPVQFELPDEDGSTSLVDFSPDGEWLATGNYHSGYELWNRIGTKRVLSESDAADGASKMRVGVPRFAKDGSSLAIYPARTSGTSQNVTFLSVPSFESIASIPMVEARALYPGRTASDYVVGIATGEGSSRWERWTLPEGNRHALGTLPVPVGYATAIAVDPRGEWIAFAESTRVHLHSLQSLESGDSSWTIETGDAVQGLAFHPSQSILARADSKGNIGLWSTSEPSAAPRRTLTTVPEATVEPFMAFDASGSRFAACSAGATSEGRVWVWDLEGPPAARGHQLFLLGEGDSGATNVSFGRGSDGCWLAASSNGATRIWPLSERHPTILGAGSSRLFGVAMDPRGRWLFAIHFQQMLERWSLDPRSSVLPRSTVKIGDRFVWSLDIDPTGRYAIAGGLKGASLIDTGTMRTRRIEGFEDAVFALGFSPDGRRVAIGGGQTMPAESVIRIYDVETGGVLAEHRPPWPDQRCFVIALEFLSSDEIIYALLGPNRIERWSIPANSLRNLHEGPTVKLAISPDRKKLSCVEFPDGNVLKGPLRLIDLETGDSRLLPGFGDDVSSVRFAPDGRIVAGTGGGSIRVGFPDEEPHLLLGHTGDYVFVDLSADGTQIASAATDGSVRIWPMPDSGDPPFHKLDHDELMRRLYATTNIRMQRDESAPTGYRKFVAAFPGWERHPDW